MAEVVVTVPAGTSHVANPALKVAMMVVAIVVDAVKHVVKPAADAVAEAVVASVRHKASASALTLKASHLWQMPTSKAAKPQWTDLHRTRPGLSNAPSVHLATRNGVNVAVVSVAVTNAQIRQTEQHPQSAVKLAMTDAANVALTVIVALTKTCVRPKPTPTSP